MYNIKEDDFMKLVVIARIHKLFINSKNRQKEMLDKLNSKQAKRFGELIIDHRLGNKPDCFDEEKNFINIILNLSGQKNFIG